MLLEVSSVATNSDMQRTSPCSLEVGQERRDSAFLPQRRCQLGGGGDGVPDCEMAGSDFRVQWKRLWRSLRWGVALFWAWCSGRPVGRMSGIFVK